jgi:glycosyltransferase involved in cell wall biosynthesis
MKTLHVIDTLDGQGSARQLCVLAPALAHASCTVEVCCIGPDTRQADRLRQAGLRVHALGWTRWFDVGALWRLRGLLQHGGHNLIHVWRLAALRLVGSVSHAALARVVCHAPLPRAGSLSWWDRELLRRTRCVALADHAERQRWAHQGLAAVPWRIVPSAAPTESAAGSESGPPRRIVCAGRLERDRGFREAIWAADVLSYLFADLELLIAGSGPRRPDLQEMIDRLAVANAYLLGDVEADDVLAAAPICWVPSRGDCGRQTALEALALGKVVVASDVPSLRELIRDGETGYLVPPGDPVALARRTRALLRDPDRCARLGRAARADVHARFALGEAVRRWHGLYNELAA